MMSIISSVAQQYELINKLDASSVGGKPAFQAICPFGYDGLQSLVHTQKKCVPRTPGYQAHTNSPALYQTNTETHISARAKTPANHVLVHCYADEARLNICSFLIVGRCSDRLL